MLSNPEYADEFNYINVRIKDRVKFIKDIHEDYNVQSDFVLLMLNLSAIPDEVI